jgi:hypothetical protein
VWEKRQNWLLLLSICLEAKFRRRIPAGKYRVTRSWKKLRS